MYIEISARATGKTYRLIQAVKKYISESPQNIANIITATRISDETLLNNKQVHIIKANQTTKNIQLPRGFRNVRSFIDDFDHIPALDRIPAYFYGTEIDDYYCTTPSKMRYIGEKSIQELAKDDFLLRLILRNNGMYISSAPILYRNLDFVRNYKEKMRSDAFAVEMEGRFLSYD